MLRIHPRVLAVVLASVLLASLVPIPAEGTLRASDGAGSGVVRHPTPERLVAIGDLHGDLAATLRALRRAGAIDDRGTWIGGDLVVVQTGDILDRGDDERAILDLLNRLSVEAADAGGAVHRLLGNHEIMNASGDFRYVTEGGWRDFEGGVGETHEKPDSALEALPAGHRPRALAFRPGGPYARRLAESDVVLVVGRTVFVHGGVLPEHVDQGLDRLNRETRAWLRGEGPQPELLRGRDAPTWARHYSDDPDSADCALLAEILAALDCDRMVVGHTVQEGGITARCDGRVWCIDTGAAAAYGGPVEVLEITRAGMRRIP